MYNDRIKKRKKKNNTKSNNEKKVKSLGLKNLNYIGSSSGQKETEIKSISIFLCQCSVGVHI